MHLYNLIRYSQNVRNSVREPILSVEVSCEFPVHVLNRNGQ